MQLQGINYLSPLCLDYFLADVCSGSMHRETIIIASLLYNIVRKFDILTVLVDTSISNEGKNVELLLVEISFVLGFLINRPWSIQNESLSSKFGNLIY